MEEKVKSYLEKVYREFVDYKDYLKDKIKPQDQLRKEMAEKIAKDINTDDIQMEFFEIIDKQGMYQADFIGLQNRLFHTIEAYKDLIEIPEEVLTEVSSVKFKQIFKIKNGAEIVVNEELVEQAKAALKEHFEELKKYYS